MTSDSKPLTDEELELAMREVAQWEDEDELPADIDEDDGEETGVAKRFRLKRGD